MQKSQNLKIRLFWNAQCNLLPVPYSYSLIFQLYHLTILDKWYQRKKSKYDTSYLPFGFTSTGNEEAPDVVCLLCNKILANNSLAPTKLLRHLEKNHPTDKGEAHVIGESLIKPYVQNIVSCVLGESYCKQVESVSLSNNTVKKCINDIADDIKLELISRLQECNAYALQLDESTDVAVLAILLVVVRYDFNKKNRRRFASM
ncbi:zinc finger BED domain-containing protein 5 [Nephila pilipes]|uniref:Zinc finger BED domain-containing protein 5 n=1 Tax=Nephila pilipes TaxID=299642 RepID=A0A8X6TN44_NEPPI|nr:zinc finger BED domain-containing protein 5 [Nephila pilipes]